MITKQKLLFYCKDLLHQKIEEVQKQIRSYQEAANEDTKSSMGDKYETNREMMNLEKGKAATQLDQFLNMKKVLDTLPNKTGEEVGMGSLVETNRGLFFIAIGLGKVLFDGSKEVMVISGASPIGQFLMGKRKGYSGAFRGYGYEVLEIH